MGSIFVSRKQKNGRSTGGRGVTTRWVCVLCASCFFLGVFVIDGLHGFLGIDEDVDSSFSSSIDVVNHGLKNSAPKIICSQKNKVSKTRDVNHVIRGLDRRISELEMQLETARSAQASNHDRSSSLVIDKQHKVFFVMGIITAFSSRKRRDSIRRTWMPQGVDQLLKLEMDKGIVMRFVIGHSGTPGSMLDRAIDIEEEEYQDFLRLDHVEDCHELATKTQIYISTALAKWQADFYIKVDDDVHINPGILVSILGQHRLKPHVYIGCMKSGSVISQHGVKYHEPEYWKFGKAGNKYFRHAAGQIYIISKYLATYISINHKILHKYANEDVSLGSWLIGLNVEYIDDRSLCCGIPPDCEWKMKAGNSCAASFDWNCSGVCTSEERMDEVHRLCGEEDKDALWNITF
ncbi:Glycosyltransferase, family GT31 [Zostera marina]|uniref:Hexosyltransferase n=1 Tax=Zostera marina TaxID=29655 RepID=A0A0K9PCP1_ZOSMR|nr:Glycosyltransferase, family GT31 [Zostera marina]